MAACSSGRRVRARAGLATRANLVQTFQQFKTTRYSCGLLRPIVAVAWALLLLGDTRVEPFKRLEHLAHLDQRGEPSIAESLTGAEVAS
jgi:hypothetical protein